MAKKCITQITTPTVDETFMECLSLTPITCVVSKIKDDFLELPQGSSLDLMLSKYTEKLLQINNTLTQVNSKLISLEKKITDLERDVAYKDITLTLMQKDITLLKSKI